MRVTIVFNSPSSDWLDRWNNLTLSCHGLNVLCPSHFQSGTGGNIAKVGIPSAPAVKRVVFCTVMTASIADTWATNGSKSLIGSIASSVTIRCPVSASNRCISVEWSPYWRFTNLQLGDSKRGANCARATVFGFLLCHEIPTRILLCSCYFALKCSFKPRSGNK